MSDSEEMIVPDARFTDSQLAELGDICEGILLGSEGKFDPTRMTVRRKSLCQFLGIGESTFTGWVQAGRIPRAAAIAFVLHRNLQERVRRIKSLLADRLEPRVVAIDGKYAVCEFVQQDGELLGRFIAAGIADQAVAQDIARHRSRAFADLQDEAISLLRHWHDIDPDGHQGVDEVAARLEHYRNPHRIRDLLAHLVAADLPHSTEEAKS